MKIYLWEKQQAIICESDDKPEDIKIFFKGFEQKHTNISIREFDDMHFIVYCPDINHNYKFIVRKGEIDLYDVHKSSDLLIVLTELNKFRSEVYHYVVKLIENELVKDEAE